MRPWASFPVRPESRLAQKQRKDDNMEPTEYDRSAVYFSNQNLGGEASSDSAATLSRSSALQKFREFIRNFREGNVFLYRERLLRGFRKREHFLEVNLRHLNAYDKVLQDLVQTYPTSYLALFELAAKLALSDIVHQDSQSAHGRLGEETLPDIQVLVRSDQRPVALRRIAADDINRLLHVPGIVTSASKTRAKATTVKVRCRACKNTKELACDNAFGGVTLPRHCDSQQMEVGGGGIVGGQQQCPMDPFVIVPDSCTYVDQQTLKLQESPEDVPTGEMPRNILLSVDRSLVDRVSPGTRVSVMGVSSIFNAARGGRGNGKVAVAVRTPYLRVVGMSIDDRGSGRASAGFVPEEEERIQAIARDPLVYEKLARSISPAISGDYTFDIKRAIACLLLGGSRKVLPDGMKLRGDINVLLLGDPSTAKSQFLKFVEKVAPVGVYTSGKGSSAAGLTASVVRDARGEFYLEGGAMVLGDGGVVCIDEFDKMREQDRVAIHEAMEQQTISVAKAGITTILNSRTSVLAAANPVFGTYDDMRTAAENIDFLPTILSRFDLIFIVRDIRDERRDRAMAEHVMGVHINAATAGSARHGTNGNRSGRREEACGRNVGVGDMRQASRAPVRENSDIDIETMKKFITYCRERCAPCLNDDAAEALRNHYVAIRENHRRRERESQMKQTIPITVRQLEAIVRISESLAKMSLSRMATPDHVQEAIRLFKVSTLNAAGSGAGNHFGDGILRPDVMKDVQSVENQIKRRIAIGNVTNVRHIMEDFNRQGYSDVIIRKALHVMVQRGELKHKDQQRKIQRVR